MEPLHAELFATKGPEYLLVITYLVLLTGFWVLLQGPDRGKAPAPKPTRRRRSAGWFVLPEGLHFHQGHTWAARDGEAVLKVGMDEFSGKLLGRPAALRLPEAGTRLEQGKVGWRVLVDGKAIEMLSPVDGEVLEVNARALLDPSKAVQSPYGEGWLLRVRVDKEVCPLRNLLTGDVALSWIRTAEERIKVRASGQLGLALPDGGVPVDGMAQALAPGEWEELAREILLATPC